MTSTKRVSTDIIRRAANMSSSKVKNVVWRTTNISVKYCLGARKFLDVYNAIVSDITSDSGECMIPLVDFAIRINVIAAYTNIDLPEDVEQLFDIVYGSDLYDVVLKNASVAQIKALADAIKCGMGGDVCDG